jgi:hypothetical protein
MYGAFMSTPRSRIAKGRSFQKKVMEMIKECFKLGPDDIRTPVGSENGPDVILCNDKTRKKVNLAIECKNQKAIAIWKSLDQTNAHSKATGMPPALIFHRSIAGNKDIYITVTLEHYLELRKKLI